MGSTSISERWIHNSLAKPSENYPEDLLDSFFWVCLLILIIVAAGIITHSMFLYGLHMNKVRMLTDAASCSAIIGSICAAYALHNPSRATAAVLFDCIFKIFGMITQLCDIYLFYNRLSSVTKVPTWKSNLINIYIWGLLVCSWLPAYTIVPFFYDTNTDYFQGLVYYMLLFQGVAVIFYNLFFTLEFVRILYPIYHSVADIQSQSVRRTKLIAMKSIGHCTTSSVATIVYGALGGSNGVPVFYLVTILGMHFWFNFKVEEVEFIKNICKKFRGQEAFSRAQLQIVGGENRGSSNPQQVSGASMRMRSVLIRRPETIMQGEDCAPPMAGDQSGTPSRRWNFLSMSASVAPIPGSIVHDELLHNDHSNISDCEGLIRKIEHSAAQGKKESHVSPPSGSNSNNSGGGGGASKGSSGGSGHSSVVIAAGSGRNLSVQNSDRNFNTNSMRHFSVQNSDRNMSAVIAAALADRKSSLRSTNGITNNLASYAAGGTVTPVLKANSSSLLTPVNVGVSNALSPAPSLSSLRSHSLASSLRFAINGASGVVVSRNSFRGVGGGDINSPPIRNLVLDQLEHSTVAEESAFNRGRSMSRSLSVGRTDSVITHHPHSHPMSASNLIDLLTITGDPGAPELSPSPMVAVMSRRGSDGGTPLLFRGSTTTNHHPISHTLSSSSSSSSRRQSFPRGYSSSGGGGGGGGSATVGSVMVSQPFLVPTDTYPGILSGLHSRQDSMLIGGGRGGGELSSSSSTASVASSSNNQTSTTSSVAAGRGRRPSALFLLHQDTILEAPNQEDERSFAFEENNSSSSFEAAQGTNAAHRSCKEGDDILPLLNAGHELLLSDPVDIDDNDDKKNRDDKKFIRDDDKAHLLEENNHPRDEFVRRRKVPALPAGAAAGAKSSSSSQEEDNKDSANDNSHHQISFHSLSYNKNDSAATSTATAAVAVATGRKTSNEHSVGDVDQLSLQADAKENGDRERRLSSVRKMSMARTKDKNQRDHPHNHSSSSSKHSSAAASPAAQSKASISPETALVDTAERDEQAQAKHPQDSSDAKGDHDNTYKRPRPKRVAEKK